jgi:zinc transport system ATP-binding protein
MSDHPVAPPVLSVEHLAVSLDGVEILGDLSFEIERASLVAVIGPNGSGKTVLFRALIGVVPHGGTVTWASGTRIGYVPQKLDLERELPVTGHDLLRARQRIARAWQPASRAHEIARVLARVDLSADTLNKLVGTLSGGQFQRLLMAFALLGDPTVLLLDEPTAGVDDPGQERLNDTVRRLQQDGVTVLLISHDLSVVSKFATSVLCLTREHAGFGIARKALTPEVLARVYGEPVGLVDHER